MKETDKAFEQRLERRMKNWKQEQHEKKVFGLSTTEHDESDDIEAAKRLSVSEELMHELEPIPEPRKATVYDGWFWNGHLNKFERWKQHLKSLKTKEFLEWYNGSR